MAYPDTRRIREMQAATKAVQAEEEARLAEEARRAEEAARRESAIKQQAASQATERQPIEIPQTREELAQEALSNSQVILNRYRQKQGS